MLFVPVCNLQSIVSYKFITMTETCSVEYHNIEMVYTLALVKQHHFRSPFYQSSSSGHIFIYCN